MKARIIVGFAAIALAIAAAAAILALSGLSHVRPAPEVRFTPLSGETFSTSDLRGKVVLVNFWATYCGSCLKEMPRIVDTHRKFAPRGYETVAVAVRRDNPERVAKYASSHALPFRVALDSSGEAAKEFGNVRITPMSFLIDKKGRVLRRYVGEPNWTEVHDLVERALAS
ncbi:MAG TPA: TlpA disulfide reductase family protein [Burkholderiales bacterium]|nr:TlpA disulfide reductase family protein [Burkholderiales bacterium]